MRYVRYAGLVLSVVLISDVCSGMRQPLWSSTPYIGSDERPVVKKPKPFIPPVPQKSPKQLAAERKQRREQIWRDAYERASIGIVHNVDSIGNIFLNIRFGNMTYKLNSSGKLFRRKRASGIYAEIDYKKCPFKITSIMPGRAFEVKVFEISYNKNDAIFSLIWDTDGTVIVNDICCAIKNIPIYLPRMSDKSLAIKAAKVIMIGNNAADEVTVSASDRIINCGELFCTGDCKLISYKIVNYGFMSDGKSGKPKNDEAEFVGVDDRFYDFYKAYSSLFNLPIKNGFYNFGALNFKNKHVSIEDLGVNLIGNNTYIEKTLTQSGDNCILRIVNEKFYRSALQETLKKTGWLSYTEKSGIHIGGLSTGMIFTNLLSQKDLNKKGGKLSNGACKTYIKLLNMPRLQFESPMLRLDDSAAKPKILTWDQRHGNVMSVLKQDSREFNHNEEVAHISSVEQKLNGGRDEYNIDIGQYSNVVYHRSETWRLSDSTNLGTFGEQLANYLLACEKEVNSDGRIYDLHEYLLGDTSSEKKPKTKPTLVLGAANNPFSNIIKEYYEFDKPQIKGVVYDNFLFRIYRKDSNKYYSYVMTCNALVDPEGKISITEYLSGGALSRKATEIVIGKLNECIGRRDV